MPALRPEHLLDQADRLIAAAGGGAPRQADLKRAISGAYYALFHAVVSAAADEFVGKTQTARNSAGYALAYRSIDHRALKTLCQDVVKPKMPAKLAKYAPAGGFSRNIKSVAAAVIDLQELRHLADYDPQFRAQSSGARSAVSMARTAIRRFQRARSDSKAAFLYMLAFPPR